MPPGRIGDRAISFGLVDGRAVFVDELDDSYFMLEPDDRHLLDVAVGRAHLDASQPLSVLAAGEPACIVEASPPRPTQELDARPRNRCGLVDAFRAAAAIRRTRRDLARRPIGVLLDELRQGADPIPFYNGADIALLVGRFMAARRLVPVAANCLLDSISLARWLGASAPADTALVFGVKLDPFGAHCWLQSGELLLNDRIEHVARFTPVRVVPCSRATL